MKIKVIRYVINKMADLFSNMDPTVRSIFENMALHGVDLHTVNQKIQKYKRDLIIIMINDDTLENKLIDVKKCTEQCTLELNNIRSNLEPNKCEVANIPDIINKTINRDFDDFSDQLVMIMEGDTSNELKIIEIQKLLLKK